MQISGWAVTSDQHVSARLLVSSRLENVVNIPVMHQISVHGSLPTPVPGIGSSCQPTAKGISWPSVRLIGPK